MNGKRQRLRPTRIKNRFGTFRAHGVADPVGIKLLPNKAAKVGALPAAFREKHMRVRQRFDATLHRRHIVVDIFRLSQSKDRLNYGKHIPCAMVNLAS